MRQSSFRMLTAVILLILGICAYYFKWSLTEKSVLMGAILYQTILQLCELLGLVGRQ